MSNPSVGGVTYLVTGFMRTGTSMMMRALYEGMARAIPMVASEERIARLNAGETIPNHEYLEPPKEAWETMEFPRAFEGHLLKCLMAGTHPLWPMPRGLHVVQMWRDPKVIRDSWMLHEKVFGPPPPWLPDGYTVRMAASSAMLRNRKDVLSVTELWFHDVIEDPAGAFETLARAGWPITDLDAAISVVNPELVRAGV